MKSRTLYLAITLLFQLAGSQARASTEATFQWSTISALQAGVFQGSLSFAQLRRHGDFGLGTFDALDGEMIELDGLFYQVRSDGRVYQAAPSARTPFAVVQFFHRGHTVRIEPDTNFQQLQAALTRTIPNKNWPCAVRIRGVFDYVKTRSVPRQKRPYPTLLAATLHQKTFELHHVSGTMVGFRFPDYMTGVNVPGYHFHFITTDHRAGGHVLDCRFHGLAAEWDARPGLTLLLPTGETFASAHLGGMNRSDLDKAEKSKK